MYIEVRAINGKDLEKRGMISFYFEGKRYRYYNGKHLGLDINPNRQVTHKLKSASLEQLKFKTIEALNDGWNPENGVYNKFRKVITKGDTVEKIIESILENKLNSPISLSYKNDLRYLVRNLFSYLTRAEKEAKITNLSADRLISFLYTYNTSASNYNNKRRMLSVIFNEVVDRGYLLKSPLKNTRKQKQKVTLHVIYKDDELTKLLEYLKSYNDDLYLMALIMYGCLLRPHTEILSLCKKHFNTDYSKIILSGKENKGGGIRVVNVPKYVKEALENRIEYLSNNDTNLFSLSLKKNNVGYFNTLWDRAKKDMLSKGILKSNQTIYSIRHTSAVRIYQKCKDVSIVQKMMGHSNMSVTLTYLRSLGQMDVENLIDYIPEI